MNPHAWRLADNQQPRGRSELHDRSRAKRKKSCAHLATRDFAPQNACCSVGVFGAHIDDPLTAFVILEARANVPAFS